MTELYAIYLRKSRADMDDERMGIDTLSRHEQILTAFAKEKGYKIGKIYREVVSGDSIAARSEMQQLLSDVEQGYWKGVIVVEVERLARGDTIDQGIIAQTFKYSDTRIITPYKTYDPNDEFDEEFFEYGLFQSRREYKAITRRQQRGIMKSVEDGKWPYNKAPYGYERYKLPDQKGYSLKIVPEQAEIVRFIFDQYANTPIGYSGIADKLNEMKVKSPMKEWHNSTIKGILVNPVYIGKIKRGARACVKKMVNGELKVTRPRHKEYKTCDGLHEPIIDVELFNKVNERLMTHKSKPVASALEIRNPLAGLVYCKACGKKMVRRPNDKCKTMIICNTKGCTNISSYEYVLEDAVIDYLGDYLEMIKADENNKKPNTTISLLESSISSFDEELDRLNSQLNKAYDLVEQGVYTTDVFLQRSESINKLIQDTLSKKTDLEKKLRTEKNIMNKNSYMIPKIENLLTIYDTLSVPERNHLLSEVIERIDYLKTERSKMHGPYNNFEIYVKPRIPLN